MFVGEFQCLDQQGNLVLGRAAELMGPNGAQQRPVGMALVPAVQRKLVEVQVRGRWAGHDHEAQGRGNNGPMQWPTSPMCPICACAGCTCTRVVHSQAEQGLAEQLGSMRLVEANAA